jgi:hypothetical protein
VSWLDRVKGFTLKLGTVFYQSNLSNQIFHFDTRE